MFVKSISYWSFPGGMEGTRPVAEVFAHAKKAGFEAVEVCLGETGDVSLQTTEQSARNVIKAAGDNGIQIASVATGLFWAKSLSASDPKVRGQALEIGMKLIDVAAWLDAKVVLVVPGAVDVFFAAGSEVVEYGVAYERATESIAKLETHAKAAKITVGIENVWNKFLLSPIEMRDFVDQFKSQWVGVYFDVGNCVLWAYPEHWIRVLGKRIKRVHLKDYKREVGTAAGVADLLSGDVNWPEVIRALKEVGYSGPLTAEMIPSYKYYPDILIDNTSRAMDAILGRR